MELPFVQTDHCSEDQNHQLTSSCSLLLESPFSGYISSSPRSLESSKLIWIMQRSTVYLHIKIISQSIQGLSTCSGPVMEDLIASVCDAQVLSH